MRIVIAIFFFVVGAALLALPWRSENGVVRWPLKIGLAVVCVLAGLAGLFVPFSD
jgi:hypothetical protein